MNVRYKLESLLLVRLLHPKLKFVAKTRSLPKWSGIPLGLTCKHLTWLERPASDETLLPGNTKGGSITLPLTSCLAGLESAV
jgi:hypothetical protein